MATDFELIPTEKVDLENSIMLGDSERLLKLLQNDFVDLTVTSPPYDSLRKYNGVGDTWCFDKFKEIANELYRVTKPGGVVVWVINDKTDHGSKTGTSFKHALYFMELGFNLNDTMIWRKTNPMPAVRQPRYADCFEYMFVFSKGKPKTFNPIMRKTKFGGKNYDSTAKNMDGESGRHKLTYVVNSEAVDYNVWDIAVAQNKTCHPAVFPYELAKKHILSWSNPGDLVLDPFAGSGTTLLAARDLGRNYIGMEMNVGYFSLCEERLFGTKTCLENLAEKT